ncbi:MAG: hypothetical protein ACXU9O_10000 [Gemmatimonadaceae bacterium]
MTRTVVAMLSAALAFTAMEAAGAQQVPVSAAPPAKDSTRMATVTYISGTSVYAGAGRLDGVREGMVLEVLRAGSVIARANVAFLASHSSSSEIVWSATPPAVGDSVRFHPAAAESVAIVTDSAPVRPASRAETAAWRRPIRGHVGVRYLSVSQPGSPGTASLGQPSADVRIEGTHLAGGAVGFMIDGRARTTVGPRDSTVNALDQHMQVYQASISLGQQGSGARISVGRQYSPALASAGLFDGVTAELNGARWGMGVFNATQPDVATMAFSSAIREAGGYVQAHSGPEGTPWSLTAGGVASRDSGQLNRQFGFAQLTVSSRVMTLYAMQEVDFNSGWKRAAGEAAVTPTTTFASVSLRPVDALSFHAGVDNRRNVLLYRDYVNAVTAFDDAFREGVWGGANLLLPAIRIGADARVSQGGPAGKADQVSGSLGIGPLLPKRIDLRLRSTRYRTERTTGWLHAWTAGADPFDVLHVELNGGVRTQRVADPLVSATGFTPLNALSDGGWLGASVDLSVGRSWYMLVSGTRDRVGLDRTQVVYCSVMLRF